MKFFTAKQWRLAISGEKREKNVVRVGGTTMSVQGVEP